MGMKTRRRITYDHIREHEVVEVEVKVVGRSTVELDNQLVVTNLCDIVDHCEHLDDIAAKGEQQQCGPSHQTRIKILIYLHRLS